MAGEMLQSLKNSRFQAGAPAYFFHTLKTLLRYRPVPVFVDWTDATGVTRHLETDLLNLFVCNGRFSGGGMEWAPRATLDSGELHVTIISGTKKWPLVRHSGKLYRGDIETFPGASSFAARELTIRCESKLSLETDGEVVTLPEGVESKFEFKVLGGVFPLVL
jgi:diacylglycerol kinase family enzyme